MQYEKFKFYLQNPDAVGENELLDINQLVDLYPFFNLGRWLRLRALKNTQSIYFEKESEKVSVFTNERRNLFYFIFPETVIEEEPQFNREAGTGSYFDIIGGVDKHSTEKKRTLSELAKKLMSAKESFLEEESQNDSIDEVTKIQSSSIDDKNQQKRWSELENESKRLIKENKFKDALVILEELNLNNPKKSVYFADQIRFLKRIVEN